ncbi:MAG: alpha/beta hydrolase [bacterium]|nr:alpha/beta hydrolase [bacterium]
MSQRDRLDPQSRGPLEELLTAIPGGLNAIRDLKERRVALHALLAGASEGLPPNTAVSTEDRVIPGPEGDPDISVRIFRPVGATGTRPGIYFIHGGGMVLGSVDDEAGDAAMLCEELQAIVVSVEYRLAPEHPYPAPVDDCYAGLAWTAAHADELGIDPDRLAVFGKSAGGGLTIATCLKARERKGPKVCFQMPIYPMIDDRNLTPSSREITEVGIWDRAANIEAWGWYLNGLQADQYAAPARATSLVGLPPAFIDVGEMDMFRDEDIAFAARLLQAGVSTEFHLYPGAYHGSDSVAPEADLTKRMWQTRLAALRRALGNVD